jgi:hypothetical protein
VTHGDRLLFHIDISVLRQVPITTEGYFDASLLLGHDDGAALGHATEEGGDVRLTLRLVGRPAWRHDAESLLPVLGVHLPEHVSLTGTLGRTALRGADGQRHVVGHVDGQLLGTLGHLLEVRLDTVEFLVTLLDVEGTTVGLENNATLGIHELGGSRHLLFTEIIFLMALQPYHPFLFDLLVFLSIFSRVL